MAPRNNENIPVLTPYNPLDKRHLGEQVAEALLEQDVQPLPPSWRKTLWFYKEYTNIL